MEYIEELFNEFCPSVISANISTIGYLELKLSIESGRFDNGNIVLGRCGRFFDTWKGEYGCTEFIQVDNRTVILRVKKVPPFEINEDEFHYIQGVNLSNSSTNETIRLAFPSLKKRDFLVWTDKISNGRLSNEVLLDYDSLIEQRKALREKGLGQERQTTKVFQAVSFLNQVHFTKKVDYFDFQLIPFQPLKLDNVGELIWNFLKDTGLNLDEQRVKQIINDSGHQPTAIMIFPKVHSVDHNDNFSQVISESKRFMNLSALNRGSHGELLGTISLDLSSGDLAFSLNSPSYRGNLMGGFVSGEDFEHTYDQIQNLRGNNKAQLFLELYNEARREKDIEFSFFRLWNILETISKTKGLIGQPLVKWDGTPVLNNRNQPRYIQNHSKELVFELLRETFSGQAVHSGYFGNHLRDSDSDILMDKILTVGYQHRNCTAHRGGCFPNDTTICDRTKDSCILCKQETEKIVKDNNHSLKLIGDYYSAVDRFVKTVIAKEIR